jgi:phosphohistidine phosphatase
MKTVTLFRHAKAGDKDNPNMADIDRPLSDRGLKAAPKMGAAMRDWGVHPDLIVCSTSVRTRQTLTLASSLAWDDAPETRFEKKIYEASPETLLKILKGVAARVEHVMIVGHNPGLQDLAIMLALPHSDELEQIEEKLPTGTVLSLEFEAERWKDLQAGSGRIAVFITPKTLSAKSRGKRP